MPGYTFATGTPNITPAVYSVDDTETDLNTTPTATASNGVLTLTLDAGDYYAEWSAEGDVHRTGGVVIARDPDTYQDADAGSGGSGAATRDQYWTASRTTVTSGDYINLPFVEQAGHHHDHLLDLTDPTQPTAIADGVYAVTAMVDAGAVTAGKAFFVELDIDSNGDDAIATAVGDLGHDAGNGRPQATVSATFFCPAGGVISVLVSHDKGADETFRLTAAVQRLS